MANSNATTGKTPGGTVAVIQAVLKGCQSAIPPTTKLNMAGTSVAVTQVETTLTGDLQVFTAVETAQAAYKQAISAREAALPGIKTFLQQLKTALEAQLGKGNPVLAQFGYPVGQKKVLTAAEKTAANAKRQATLQKRGVVGKRKRAAVVASAPTVTVGPNGVVTTPAATPGESPAAPGTTAPVVNAPGSSTSGAA
jgi:hypothetical protein